MHKAIKITIALVVIVVVLLIAVPAIILALYDTDRIKSELEDRVQQATGRQLSIAGDLDLSVFPWLGFEVEGVRLSNATGFGPQPFAEIGSAQVHVKLLPLLHSEVALNTVILNDFTLRLAQHADGKGNWQDLLAVSQSAEPKSVETAPQSGGATVPAALGALVIGGVYVNHATLIWNDQVSGQHVEIRELHLKTGEIVPQRPFALDLSFKLAVDDPKMSVDSHLSSDVNLNIAERRLDFEQNRLSVVLSGAAIPASSLKLTSESAVKVDLKQDMLQLTSFSAELGQAYVDGQLQADHLSTTPEFRGTLKAVATDLRTLLKQWNVTIPTIDPKALSTMNMHMDFDGGMDQFHVAKLQLELDQSKLSGSFGIRHFAQPAVTYSLAVDEFDADRYLPPETAPAPVSATPAPAAAAASASLPLPLLRALKLKGELAIDRLKMANLRTSSIKITTAADKGLIRMSPISADLYGGRYRGNITADARGKVMKLSFDETLNQVNASPLVKDMIGKDLLSGLADVAVKLSVNGVTPDEARRTLSGTARFSFQNGAVKGVNIAKLIREAKARLENKPLPPDNAPLETDFTALTGSLRVANGVVNNRDLVMKSPYLRIAGQGSCNLVNEEINYHLDTKIVGSSSGQAGKELEELKGLTIPIRVGGTFSKPSYYPDLKRLLKDKANQEVQKQVDKAKEKLEQKLNKQLQNLLSH